MLCWVGKVVHILHPGVGEYESQRNIAFEYMREGFGHSNWGEGGGGGIG